VEVHELDGSFPRPTRAALAAADRLFASLPSGPPVIVDGLAYGALPELAAAHGTRLSLLALVHHPLALETGLRQALAARLASSERRALAHARHVVATSRCTARTLTEYGVDPQRITVIEPGTVRAEPRRVCDGGIIELLCVATLVPRKGHATLIEALARVADKPWHLTCVGSDTRDPACARALQQQVRVRGLVDRIVFSGEVDAEVLERLYRRAHVFVLATHHEGYGMALAEAIAHGLPVVCTRAGAVPETLPPEACLLVPAGDCSALAGALAALLDAPALRAQLATAAAEAGRHLPTWAQASARFAALLDVLARS
jgi:glycosyltransferase involved in cell wall biosynthesis